MKTNIKNKSDASKTRIRVVSLVLLAWFVFWLPFQLIFILDVPYLDSLLSPDNLPTHERLVRYSLVLAASAFLACLIYHRFVHIYKFFKTKKWIFLLYLLPLAAMINLYINQPSEIFGVNTLLYILFMTLSVAYQDILTFGFLQTILEKNLGGLIAAIITGVVFYIGHLNFSLDVFSLIHMLGFIVFSFSRYLTGSIYIANIIHLTFVLMI